MRWFNDARAAAAGQGTLFANAQLAETVRAGWLTPPVLADRNPAPVQADHGLQRSHDGIAARPGKPVIYLDSSVALAHLLAEDRALRQRAVPPP
jgi:hypothetical protein